MKCTNYGAEPFRSIVQQTNRAAADYIASVIEASDFRTWYGSDKLPVVKDMKITNAAGKVWDLRATLNTWKKQEAIRLGIVTQEGKPVLHQLDKDGVFKDLSAYASAMNSYKGTPFKMRVVRKTVEQEDGSTRQFYAHDLEFNRDYIKEPVEYTPKAVVPEVTEEPDDSFFYMRSYDTAALSSGKKTVSLRPTLQKEGVYVVDRVPYRVTLRGNKPMMLKDVKEGKKALRDKFIAEDDVIATDAVNAFFDGKKAMFVYDIKKLDASADEAKLMPDFMGAMAIGVNRKASGAKNLTGYADLDKYIETLVATRTSLYRQRAAVKADLSKVQDIDARISAIDKSIADLKADAELSTLMKVGKTMLNQLQADLQTASSFNDIDNGLRLAKAWSELNTVIDMTPEEEPDEETKQIIKDAGELILQGSNLFTSYLKKYKAKLLSTTDAYLKEREKDGEKSSASESLVDEEGNIVFMDVDKWGALFIGKSFSTNAMEQLLDELLRESDHRATQENYNFEIRLAEQVQDLLGKTPQGSKVEDFDFLFTKGKDGSKSLLTKYDRDFYKQFHIKQYLAFEKGKRSQRHSEHYQAALALGATADELKGDLTMKDYYAWESQYFTYKLTAEGQAEYERFMQEQRKHHIIGHETDSTPIYDEEAIKKIEKEWDPQTFQNYLDGDKKVYNKGRRWFTREQKHVPVSKEYAKLTSKQLKFYNFFIGEFIDGQQDLVRDHRFGEVDLDAQLLDFIIGARGELKDRVKHLGKGLNDFIRNTYTPKGGGDPVVRNATRALTGKEHIGTEFKSLDRFIPDNNQVREVHPLQVLEQFRKAGFLFKHKREIEDTVNAINDLAQTADKVETLPDGRLKSSVIGKVLTSKAKTNIADRIEYNAKVGLTGVRMEALGSTGAQIIESVNNYTRFKNMALSPLSAVGNLTMGSVNNMIYAASGEYYNDKELAQAYWIMKENFIKAVFAGQVVTPTAGKIVELFKRYGLLGDVTEELYHEGDMLAKFYALQKNGEFMNQGATIIAQMLREKVEVKDGDKTKKVSLWDMYGLDSKTKKLTFASDKLAEGSEWLEDKKHFNFYEKVKKVNLKIHGDYTNALMAKKDQWGRVALMFRTWLPMAVKERFGAEYTDEMLGQQKGRYRSLGGIAGKAWRGIKTGNVAETTDLLKFIGKVLAPILGRKMKFSDELSEVDRNNLALMVRETQFILMLIMACAMLKANIDDEDDEDTKSMLRYLYNQTERAQSELQFFFHPKDAMQIVKDVAPLSATLVDAWKVIARTKNWALGEEDTYQRGVNKGRSKAVKAMEDFTPVLRSINKAYNSSQMVMSDSRYE
jgi:hypothetical protein